MPPMVCPSPVILDHSFPTDPDLLTQAMASLANLQSAREMGSLIILATPVFQDFVTQIAWEKIAQYPELLDIHRFMVSLFLQPNDSLRIVETDGLPEATPHPLPQGCADTDSTQLWTLEVGKLRDLHDASSAARPFAGVACHRGFAGQDVGTYEPDAAPRLPLVGLANLEELHSATTWQTTPNVSQQAVRYRDAKRHLPLLGGHVSKEAEGSHFKVEFNHGRRPWILDYNIDPLSEQHLKEICPIVNKPLDYVKQVLIYGEIPKEIFLL